MKAVFYKIECLTNLHVGSGEVNYNIVDNEVAKDAVTGLPVIHASGVKGALRDALSSSKTYTASEIDKIFGAPGEGESGNGGSHKFLDACLISRPMRVSGSDSTSSISVVTVDSLNGFLAKANAFGADPFGIGKVSALDFGVNEFLTSSPEAIKVENDATGKLGGADLAELSKLEFPPIVQFGGNASIGCGYTKITKLAYEVHE